MMTGAPSGMSPRPNGSKFSKRGLGWIPEVNFYQFSSVWQARRREGRRQLDRMKVYTCSVEGQAGLIHLPKNLLHDVAGHVSAH